MQRAAPSEGADWLDPVEFPFTETELRAALAPWTREPGCETMADDLVQSLRYCCLDRQRALLAIKGGSRDPSEINYSFAAFPNEVFALIAELSADHASRVEKHVESVQAERRTRRLADAMRQASLNRNANSAEEAAALIAAEEQVEIENWRATRERVRRHFLR